MDDQIGYGRSKSITATGSGDHRGHLGHAFLPGPAFLNWTQLLVDLTYRAIGVLDIFWLQKETLT